MNPLSKTLTWIIWTILLVAYVYMAAYVMRGASESIGTVAPDPVCATPFDLQIFCVTQIEAQKTMECFGDEGRKIYRGIASHEDVGYPIAYGLFYAFTLFSLSSFCVGKKGITVVVTLIPLLTVISDLIENHYIIEMIKQFPVLRAETVSSMSLFNSIKWILFFSALVLTLIFSSWSIIIMVSRRKTANSV